MEHQEAAMGVGRCELRGSTFLKWWAKLTAEVLQLIGNGEHRQVPVGAGLAPAQPQSSCGGISWRWASLASRRGCAEARHLLPQRCHQPQPAPPSPWLPLPHLQLLVHHCAGCPARWEHEHVQGTQPPDHGLHQNIARQ